MHLRRAVSAGHLLACAVGAASCLLVLLTAPASAAPVIKVAGPDLVDGAGKPVQLRGVNRSGSEFACSVAGSVDSKGYSIFDGPHYESPNLSQPAWTLLAMRTWAINAVRIPLSEHCWLGDIVKLNPAYSGAAYREAIRHYVDQLGEQGMHAILELHVVGPDGAPNLEGEVLPLPDAQNAAEFWASVAGEFKTRTHVLYDAYNEPHLYQLPDATARWACWRDGCTIDPVGTPPPYTAAGMASLVTAIRNTGSTQPIMLGGLAYANDLERWLSHLPADPANALVASFHSYPAPTGACVDEVCWNATVGAIRQAGRPVVTGEVGDKDCTHAYLQRYMNWADSQGGISYLAWAWNETAFPSFWSCAVGPALITTYDGTPTQTYGATYRSHLLARKAAEDAVVQTPPVTPPPPIVVPIPPGPDPTPAPRTLRRQIVVGGNRRLRIAALETRAAGPCVAKGGTATMPVAVALDRLRTRRAQRGFSIRGLRVLVDGSVQRTITRAGVGGVLTRGRVSWKTKTSAGRPFAAGSRHTGAVELVTGLRRNGRTTVRRTRLSIPFYVCT
jgi:endoglucanase